MDLSESEWKGSQHKASVLHLILLLAMLVFNSFKTVMFFFSLTLCCISFNVQKSFAILCRGIFFTKRPESYLSNRSSAISLLQSLVYGSRVMLILVTASISGCLHTLGQTTLPPAPTTCCTVQLQAILGRESSVCIGLDAVLSPKSWAELYKLSQSSSPTFYHLAHRAALERQDLSAQRCANSLYSERNLFFLEWIKPCGFWTKVDVQWGTQASQS